MRGLTVGIWDDTPQSEMVSPTEPAETLSPTGSMLNLRDGAKAKSEKVSRVYMGLKIRMNCRLSAWATAPRYRLTLRPPAVLQTRHLRRVT